MSEIKLYDAPKLRAYEPEKAQGFSVYLAEEADASIAAKDARIAELEAYICYADEVSTCAEQLLKMIQIDAFDVTKDMVAVLRLDAALKELESFDNTCADGDATATPSEGGANYDKFYAGLYHKSSPMWKELHDLAVSKGYDHVRFAIECAPVYKCDCMGARKVAIDTNGKTRPCECVESVNKVPITRMAREVPEIVGKFCWMDEDMGDGYYVQCVHDLPERIIDNERELMTVAQHSRIVAAKDAEIARLSTLVEAGHKLAMDAACAEISALEAELAELRAQPARQVGGDELSELERLMGMLPLLPWRAEKYNKDSATYSNALGGKPSFKPVYLEPMHLLIAQDELGWPLADFIAAAANALPGLIAQARAALAPAAVAVVMPERKEYPSRATYPDSREFDAACLEVHVWNTLLDKVTRLNRRAIPVGLLESVLIELESGMLCNPDPADIAELRALLGKY